MYYFRGQCAKQENDRKMSGKDEEKKKKEERKGQRESCRAEEGEGGGALASKPGASPHIPPRPC